MSQVVFHRMVQSLVGIKIVQAVVAVRFDILPYVRLSRDYLSCTLRLMLLPGDSVRMLYRVREI